MSTPDQDFEKIVHARHAALDTPMAGYVLYGSAALLLAAQMADGASSLEPLMALAPVLGAGYIYLYHRNHKILQTAEREYIQKTAPQHAQKIEELTLKQIRHTRKYGAQLALGLGLALGAAAIAYACDVASVHQAATGAMVFGGAWIASHRSRKAIHATVGERLETVNEIKNGPVAKEINQWIATRRNPDVSHNVNVEGPTSSVNVDKAKPIKGVSI